MRIQPDSEKKLKINQSKDQAVRRCKTYMKCRVRVRVNQEAQKRKEIQSELPKKGFGIRHEPSQKDIGIRPSAGISRKETPEDDNPFWGPFIQSEIITAQFHKYHHKIYSDRSPPFSLNIVIQKPQLITTWVCWVYNVQRKRD